MSFRARVSFPPKLTQPPTVARAKLTLTFENPWSYLPWQPPSSQDGSATAQFEVVLKLVGGPA